MARKKRKEIVVATPYFRCRKEALPEDTAGVEALDITGKGMILG